MAKMVQDMVVAMAVLKLHGRGPAGEEAMVKVFREKEEQVGQVAVALFMAGQVEMARTETREQTLGPALLLRWS